jgi:AraC-like DNA-binding protein
MKVRMNYARHLMHSEGLRVNGMSDLLGFSSPFQFSAQYRHIHGLSPSHDVDE